jgi:hypothetical protein
LLFPSVVVPVCHHSHLSSFPSVIIPVCHHHPHLSPSPSPSHRRFRPSPCTPPIHPASSCLQRRWGCWVMTMVPAVVFMPVVPIAVPLAVFSLSRPVSSAPVSLGCVELWHGQHLGYRGCQR